MERSAGLISLNRTQRGLIAVVVSGAVVIAAVGFAGSYTAVRELAIRKGFGSFAAVFPIGVDAGIGVLLALDLLLTWLRIPFPMLRQAAWLLTAATIGFNAAAAWPDPVGVGMHGVIPVLFVVTVEAARHAVGRLAAITADRHMEGVRLWRWLLAPVPTFRLWRRMRLWEIRTYDDVIQAEQQRLVYQARLRGRHGRRWRWKAPIEELLPLRIARYGVPLEASSHREHREPEEGAKRSTEVEKHSVPDGTDRLHLATGTEHAGGAEQEDPSVDESLVVLGEVLHDDRSRDEVDESGADQHEEGPLRVEVLEAESMSERDALTSSAASSRRGASTEPGPGGSPPTPGNLPGDEVLGGDSGDGATTGGADSDPIVPNSVEEAPRTTGNRVPDIKDKGAAGSAERAEHESAVRGLQSNAAAVRYAMSTLGSTHTPTVVKWLAAHGREVNRGQVHRITRDEEERQQRAHHSTVVKGAS
ncbi:DUF2637 domain-containing protein [Streptomyces sp. WM6378]|uniref:DUF2637 domain-containing protein n=1 Tax=Streptomyces sp. WM6378 TaxID=1415557 RepID=UPI001F3329CD|nr:DUF2637 domain-containing protein [Streptomyces sp. WM6378]